MHNVAAVTSPFNCVWIPRGSIARLDGVAYAVCTRIADYPRTVSEEDCLSCPLWQEPARIADDRI